MQSEEQVHAEIDNQQNDKGVQIRWNQQNIYYFINEEQINNTTSTCSIIPLFPDKINFGKNTIKHIQVSFKARDQGWGNRKGEVFLRILKHNNQQFVDVSLTRGMIVEHQENEYLFDSCSLGHQIHENDSVQFMCRVGGGGGHQLFVSNFKAMFAREKQNQDIEPIIFFQKAPLYPYKIRIQQNLSSIKIKFGAKSDKNVEIHFGIWKNGTNTMEQTHSISRGPLENDYCQYLFESKTLGQQILAAGDQIEFICKTENEGQCKVYMKKLEVTLVYQGQKTKVFSPLQSFTSPYTYGNSSKAIPIFEQLVDCSSNVIKRLLVRCRVKCQGYESQKSQILLKSIAQNGSSKTINLFKTSEQWDNKFYQLSNIELGSSPSKLQFMCIVYGGNRLFVQDFEARITTNNIFYKCF